MTRAVEAPPTAAADEDKGGVTGLSVAMGVEVGPIRDAGKSVSESESISRKSESAATRNTQIVNEMMRNDDALLAAGSVLTLLDLDISSSALVRELWPAHF